MELLDLMRREKNVQFGLGKCLCYSPPCLIVDSLHSGPLSIGETALGA